MTYTLNFKEYDTLRKGLNRITAKQRSDGAKDKHILAHNSLLTKLDSKRFPEEFRPYRKDTIFKFVAGNRNKAVLLSEADQSAAIQLVNENKREIARKAPQELLRLRNDLELASLEVLISQYEEMLGKDLTESRWQTLFNENPFILNLAFGYPVVKIQDQAHLGGRRLSGSGETIADFLVKNRISNNAALFEIKTPGTALLNKTAYRGELYIPSSALSGAMNQMLDQKNEFQKHVAQFKENSRIYDIESYAVHGVLVIGTTPTAREKQKSFELFRGNSKDITIMTFDELLAKLKSFQEFLSAQAPKGRQLSLLHSLETKLLQILREYQDMIQVKKLESGMISGKAPFDLRVIGRLSLLKDSFENARLEKPPYPVRFKGDNQVLAASTIEEFIAKAGEAIAEADEELRLHHRKRGGA
jgi:hypothetical protein